ncbi:MULTISPECIES: 16S rRNA (uracil(1498)-N(3))-methyltransferase [Thermocrispum]|jgi:16S rRNA (uracil1498-N3)-methyltransferase|uniref:Ribosomal RNA small subunit methyltransferase E n=1 Tax=Thermocrispum agreste TaxID=37925 RepID=A0A2W4JQT2_9PSEU|nr:MULTISPECIES: 16S rRNA (uracil(1498)-N(3))-methyltransferase [Thermocrispum]PZN00086.1 MAG: 16S rRNA (uracil(1498)-N(3))-methyltransferase [Thermocrispum agreste]
MTPPLFLVEELGEPADGAELTLTGDEAHHGASVLRLKPGEAVLVGDGAGAVAEGTVAAVRPGRDAVVTVIVRRRWVEPEPALRFTVVQALAKGDRGELAVEQAAQVGADAVIPWRAARCVARWDEGPRGAKALAKWRSVARAATKQARRPRLLHVAEPVTTRELLGLASSAALTVVLEGDAERAFADLPWPERGEVLLVVGPEGGITPEERAALASAGAVEARLGPYVLRTSTAGAVAVSAAATLTKRWR